MSNGAEGYCLWLHYCECFNSVITSAVDGFAHSSRSCAHVRLVVPPACAPCELVCQHNACHSSEWVLHPVIIAACGQLADVITEVVLDVLWTWRRGSRAAERRYREGCESRG